MAYKSRKQLQKLSNKQIAEDIKKYIKSSHTFYEIKVPELKVLAKRLHEEYSLNNFYRIFNRLWKSGRNEERSLAICAFELYKDNFDFNTWRFIKPKLKDIKSWDKLDRVASDIIGEILWRVPKLEIEILKMANSKNAWFKRMSIMSNIPLIRKGEIELAIKIASMHIHEKNENVQKAIGIILKEIWEKKPAIAKKFIRKNKNMPLVVFEAATENMKDFKIKSIQKLNDNKLDRIFFWKKI